MDNLFENIENITGKNAFIKFLYLLAEDFRNRPEEWENKTLDEYIEAVAGWVEDWSTCPNNDVNWEEIDYLPIARMLYMGKIYE